MLNIISCIFTRANCFACCTVLFSLCTGLRVRFFSIVQYYIVLRCVCLCLYVICLFILLLTTTTLDVTPLVHSAILKKLLFFSKPVIGFIFTFLLYLSVSCQLFQYQQESVLSTQIPKAQRIIVRRENSAASACIYTHHNIIVQQMQTGTRIGKFNQSCDSAIALCATPCQLPGFLHCVYK